MTKTTKKKSTKKSTKKKKKYTYLDYIQDEKNKLDDIMSKAWVADFETTTLPSYKIEGEVRVYAWCLVSIACDRMYHGIDIASFIDTIIELRGQGLLETIFYHNLAFDGAFLEVYLQNSGYDWANFNVNKKDEMIYPLTYTTLRSKMGALYSMTIITPTCRMINLFDSAKLYPIKVEKLGKAVGIEKLKDNYDYDKYRPVGYQMTDDEWLYVTHDVLIVKEALIKNFEKYPFFKITRSSLAYERMKRVTLESIYDGAENVPNDWRKRWNQMFPKTDVKMWRELHKAYAGGIVYVNPELKGKTLYDKGKTYDVNSEYPGVMLNKTFPCGFPVTFDGIYDANKIGKMQVSYKLKGMELKSEIDTPLSQCPLHIQKFKCAFKLKDKAIPCLPKKLSLTNKAVITHEDLIDPVLTLCDVDLKHFLRNYEIVGDVEFLGGWAFQAIESPFAPFIELCANEKITADKEGNEMMRLMSKLDMNGCYGKFAQNIKQDIKKSVVSEDNILKFFEVEEEEQEQNYLPMAIWITAWARDTLLTGAYTVDPDKLCYMDTDSIHFLGDTPEALKGLIDPYKLGYWKLECEWTAGKFLRDKAYAEMVDGELDVKCAGLSQEAKDNIKSFDDFYLGGTYEGTIVKKMVAGGVLLTKQTKELRA